MSAPTATCKLGEHPILTVDEMVRALAPDWGRWGRGYKRTPGRRASRVAFGDPTEVPPGQYPVEVPS